MSDSLNGISTTAEVQVIDDPFERVIGQDDAVSIVRSAVSQRRHVLLCGIPGIGKSMIAKAASTLLSPPREEICLRSNPSMTDRPLIVIHTGDEPRGRSDSQLIER